MKIMRNIFCLSFLSLELIIINLSWSDNSNIRDRFHVIPNDSFRPTTQPKFQDTIIYFEDFESGSVGWTTDDLTDDIFWHTSTFNAYLGKSWWCGMPELGGYYNRWYQMLTSPKIDLSHAVPPVTLSFMHFYKTEAYWNEYYQSWRYWDGGNVRVSTDGGQTFDLLVPSDGNYDTDTLLAWFDHGEGWEIPGYAGNSEEWIEAQFDLSQFIGDTIQIRYVFCSEYDGSAMNDSTWLNTVLGWWPLGWLIDDVLIADNFQVYFYDDGGDTETFKMIPSVKARGDWWNETSDEWYSQSHSWSCDDNALNYSVLKSPWLNIPPLGNWVPKLGFYVCCDMPDWDGNEDHGLEDYYKVEISKDDIYWYELTYDYSRERVGSDTGWVYVDDNLIYNGSLTLTSWVGHPVKIRWLVITDRNDDGGNGLGFFIDDIVIYGSSTSLLVENTNNSGTGSLRNAIDTANLIPGPNTIIFNLPETDPGYDSSRGVWTIKPQSLSPPLLDTMTTIDGTTQTVNQGDRNPYGPEIELDGSNSPTQGITIYSANNTIKGLIINRFTGSGILIMYEGAFNNRVVGNYIGTDETGEDSLGNDWGVSIRYGANNNIIGGTNPGDRNVISGNRRDSGVIIQGSESTQNKIIGNYIGISASGIKSLGNRANGVRIYDGARNNFIGGTSSVERNIISGNYCAGVYIADSDSNTVLGNCIGTDASGTIGIANAHGSLWTTGRQYFNSGIVIDNGSSNVIGDSTAGKRNLISGNYYNGIYVTKSGSRNNTISGNLIGTNMTGDVNLGNELAGVKIDTSARDNTISLGNVISFNGTDGVYIEGASTRGNIVDENTITENTRDGIRVENVNDGSTKLTNNTIKRNLIGIHVIDGVGVPTIEGNVIEDNIEAGILIEEGEGFLRKSVVEEEETIECNTISLNVTGIHVRHFSRSKRSHYQSTLTVSHNNIFSNTNYGMLNEDVTLTIVADDNWWGDASGPYSEETNPEGQGDAISGNVICSNWLSDILLLSISAVADIGGIAGSDVYVDFQVYNVGSSTHTFEMTVTDSLGWVLTPDELTLTLAMMTDMLLSIMVTIPEETEVGTENKIVLTGTSTQDPAIVGSGEAVVRVMEGERGDINLDRSVNILDVMRVVNIILGTGDPPTEYENWSADCNGDGHANILDVVGIVNVILGISECSP